MDAAPQARALSNEAAGISAPRHLELYKPTLYRSAADLPRQHSDSLEGYRGVVSIDSQRGNQA